MSRLADLIEELCPDGVEYKPLKELLRIRNGRDYKLLSSGTVPVYGSGGVMTHVSEAIGFGPTVLIPRKGSLDNVFFVEGPFWTVDTIFYTEIGPEVEPKYLYYNLKRMRLSQMNEAAGVPSMNQKKLGQIRIPVPPLEVQREIVRILDQFTTLEAELEAELEARRAQYEYYRNQLLSYDALASRGPVKWVKLGDIGTVKMCKRIHKKETADKGDVPFYKISSFGGAPTAFISRNQFMEYKSKYPYPKVGDLLISASGTIGRVVRFNGEDAYFQDSNIVWLDHDESIVSNRFLFYLYKVISWETEGGTIKRLYNSRILKQEIPVPSFCEQQRIADILDRFDALVNDISSGLPAEILARRAQYEYYRDRLLSFSEKK